DTVVVAGSADAAARGGFLTAFLEDREGAHGPVEVGAVGGLGMTLYPDAASLAGGTGSDGRVEFEGMEAVDVRLGGGGDDFVVGGEGNLLGTRRRALPPSRPA